MKALLLPQWLNRIFFFPLKNIYHMPQGLTPMYTLPFVLHSSHSFTKLLLTNFSVTLAVQQTGFSQIEIYIYGYIYIWLYIYMAIYMAIYIYMWLYMTLSPSPDMGYFS